jgi:hypothetical protein
MHSQERSGGRSLRRSRLIQGYSATGRGGRRLHLFEYSVILSSVTDNVVPPVEGRTALQTNVNKTQRDTMIGNV